ncbi:hypothetical protein [Tabrizicola sp.]|uniref:hypothetical protein n=1 Tax=Tabrizicola sp. TaxID=2005166 RepID=UPI0025D5BDA6|nr:hypothetical protein [Tabrizicola sp.]
MTPQPVGRRTPARPPRPRAEVQFWEPVGPLGRCWLMLGELVVDLDRGHQLQVMRRTRAYADAGGGVVAIMHELNLSAMFASGCGGKIACSLLAR